MTTPVPAPGAHEAIAPLLRSWHPRYRGAIAEIIALSAVVAVIGYAENALLQGLAEAFRAGGARAGAAALASRLAPAIALPLVLLASFVAARAVRLGAERRQLELAGETVERGRADLERAIVSNLLRKDDAFFVSRPAAEVLARLDRDVERVVKGRLARCYLVHALLPATANLAYLADADPRVAAAALVGTAAGTWWLHRAGVAKAEHDIRLASREGEVQATVEELLRGVPEIQVDGLHGRAEARVGRAQRSRYAAAERSWRAFASVETTAGASYVAALGAVFVGVHLMSAPAADVRVALVPVLLKVLPELFKSAKALVLSLLERRVARASAARLLEYEAPGQPAPEGPAGPRAAAPLTLEAVTYRYPSLAGGLQGGIVDLTTTLSPGRWTAIVGGSGSGKSTLLQLLLGRLRPQQGAVRLGGLDVADLPERERAAAFTLMPQDVLVLDGTIRENLALGGAFAGHSGPGATLLEASGLAALCAGKALDLRPAPSDGDGPLGEAVVGVRAELRERVAAAGYVLTPFERGGASDGALSCELLAGARCKGDAAVDRLLSPAAAPALAALGRTPSGRRIAEAATRLVEDRRALLSLAEWGAYARVAPVPVTASVWSVRRAALERGDPVDLLRVGLTAARGELGEVPDVDAGAYEPVRALLSDLLVPLDVAALHPFLSWRENALFARAELQNRRAADRLDELVLAALRARGAWAELVERGLETEVGRGGARLSGGQRQLVALCRALSRDTPVIVLDEPTSALDPASRARVVELLRTRRAGRVLVTVTHDPEVMRAADEVRVLRSGRLVGSGPYASVEDAGGRGAAAEPA